MLLMFLLACYEPERAYKTLQARGYTDIEIHGYAWAQCSEDDTTATAFKAKGPTGISVDGAVCCGLFLKGCTVRTR